MITVKELMAKLQNFSPDSPVLIYDIDEEQDSEIEIVEACLPEVIQEDGFTFINSPHYCKGNSRAEQFWHKNGTDIPIVFLREKYFYRKE